MMDPFEVVALVPLYEDRAEAIKVPDRHKVYVQINEELRFPVEELHVCRICDRANVAMMHNGFTDIRDAILEKNPELHGVDVQMCTRCHEWLNKCMEERKTDDPSKSAWAMAYLIVKMRRGWAREEGEQDRLSKRQENAKRLLDSLDDE